MLRFNTSFDGNDFKARRFSFPASNHSCHTRDWKRIGELNHMSLHFLELTIACSNFDGILLSCINSGSK